MLRVTDTKNIAAQGAQDLLKITAQGLVDKGNIEAQGKADEGKIGLKAGSTKPISKHKVV